MATLLAAAGLTAVYLLVLTSVAPGDVAVGALLGLAVARLLASSPRGSRNSPVARIRGVVLMVAETGWDMVLGSWRVVRFCLGAPTNPGFVEIPAAGRSPGGIVLWGVLTGEAPDEVPVDVDSARGVLIVHLVDVGDPDAVRARHERAHARWLRDVAG